MTLVLEELTASGHGGIAVLALRGTGAREHLATLADPARLPAPGKVALVRLRAQGELLDEVLVHAPAPDHLELSLHGSPAVVRAVATALGLSLSPAPLPGDGTRSLEEEAGVRLAHAPCAAAARVLLDQAEGALRAALEALDPARDEAWATGCDALLVAGRAARLLLRPAVVVLAGPPNAGKSTLFNALLDRERAVVSDAAGTTRDAVRSGALLGEYAVEFVDTAGDHAPVGTGQSEAVERSGIDLGRRVRAGADLVLWLARDPEATPGAEPDTPVARLTPAADLLAPDAAARALHPISAREDPATARGTVEDLFHSTLGLVREPWCAGRAVPYSEGLLDAIEGLRGQVEGNARRSALDRLLAR